MKKYILCIFVVLLIIITNSSYAFPASSKPMSKRAKMEPMIKTYDIPSEERTSNTTDFFVDDINNINSVGLLNIVKTDGSDDDCTASVIRTNNGNIAITAAHCIFDYYLQTWNTNLYFFPGYNNNVPGRVGKVYAYKSFIWGDFRQDVTRFDYGFIKFYYPEGRKLQDDTGAFDYDLVIPQGNVPATVFGYPGDNSGDFVNCPKDGQHLCQWQGDSFDFPSTLPNYEWYRGINVDVGYGSSGGPWLRNYDPNTNAGNVMGISHGILYEPYPDFSTASWAWHQDDFANLLQYAENSQ
uniref:Peptidase n=1 Tax=Rhizophagus irregularis (strain DAOM 181602 / DAOM 197198 / MUCL 43194) TaxID=747089 RepID=U9U718_RHIID